MRDGTRLNSINVIVFDEFLFTECSDKIEHCTALARSGVCKTSPKAMRKHCAKTCNLCGTFKASLLSLHYIKSENKGKQQSCLHNLKQTRDNVLENSKHGFIRRARRHGFIWVLSNYPCTLLISSI